MTTGNPDSISVSLNAIKKRTRSLPFSLSAGAQRQAASRTAGANENYRIEASLGIIYIKWIYPGLLCCIHAERQGQLNSFISGGS